MKKRTYIAEFKIRGHEHHEEFCAPNLAEADLQFQYWLDRLFPWLTLNDIDYHIYEKF